MDGETSLAALRRFYSEEVAAVANLKSKALVEALATVPRERFLGPGPWRIARPDGGRPGTFVYEQTPDANPRHLYHNVLVAIDAARELNNGHPSTLASYLEALHLEEGQRFAHIGCGVGYYTAVAATILGASGRAVAVEIDPGLAERCRRNLSDLRQVEVMAADGSTFDPGPRDAILVNAGFTHPLPFWLDALEIGGRLLVSITGAIPASPIGTGGMLRVTREPDRLRAEFLSVVSIFASPTGRAPALDPIIRQALVTGAMMRVRRLRRDSHEQAGACCIHSALPEPVCFSSE